MNAEASSIPDWLIQLWLYQPLLLVLSTLFGAFYVYFTILTFRQIKRQTELQIEAFLIVAAQKLSPEKSLSFVESAVELHNKWRDILQKNMSAAIQPDRWLVLKFTNRGRADIVDWCVDVVAEIHAGPYLAEKYNVQGEVKKWRVKYETHEDIVPTESGTAIEVPVAILGAFPRADFGWTIRYRDTRNREYTNFGGDSHSADVNALALAQT